MGTFASTSYGTGYIPPYSHTHKHTSVHAYMHAYRVLILLPTLSAMHQEKINNPITKNTMEKRKVKRREEKKRRRGSNYIPDPNPTSSSPSLSPHARTIIIPSLCVARRSICTPYETS
ncbi:hypothetical protein BO94DRAFT_261893 [Aspergillus sclerotioniger CBS 115572]|uniref:Uncharacterized protein n=1 Tax=Aspergillus sclerotioniger CBS 115572 TaxID=1450535 RepID=A0A317VDS1_9EURO|nr:hypothetical protein BO94DRAFT_261893 [Aspergillus sclerotioniger CBS 115572]PWY71052.1 hypothetical protein BO94DRAFT_261893 [Aspergillus sclerotioniger CBS 115572]